MFITPQNPEWENFLTATRSDMYHLPGFSELESRLLGGAPLAWLCETTKGKALIPLIKRPVPNLPGRFDLTSPYGYPGVLLTYEPVSAEISHLFELFGQDAAEKGYISSFIRLNPLLNRWKIQQTSCIRQWHHGHTVSLDLRNPMEAIIVSFSLNHQRNIRKLKEAGYRAVYGKWENFSDFLQAYRQTMVRRQANPYYFFPDGYFEELRRLLGIKLHFIGVADPSGLIVSGGLFTVFSNIMQYHLGGTIDTALKHSPSKLMIEGAILEGKRLDAEILHLGGGVGASTGDGLFRFKRGFSSSMHPYSTVHIIHERATYESLRRNNKAMHKTEYFPVYRAV